MRDVRRNKRGRERQQVERRKHEENRTNHLGRGFCRTWIEWQFRFLSLPHSSSFPLIFSHSLTFFSMSWSQKDWQLMWRNGKDGKELTLTVSVVKSDVIDCESTIYCFTFERDLGKNCEWNRLRSETIRFKQKNEGKKEMRWWRKKGNKT